MIGRSTQRKWQDLIEDPYTPLMIGRLLGANEMAIALLQKEENETAQVVAVRLDTVVAFFMERTPQSSMPRSEAAKYAQTAPRPKP